MVTSAVHGVCWCQRPTMTFTRRLSTSVLTSCILIELLSTHWTGLLDWATKSDHCQNLTFDPDDDVIPIGCVVHLVVFSPKKARLITKLTLVPFAACLILLPASSHCLLVLLLLRSVFSFFYQCVCESDLGATSNLFWACGQILHVMSHNVHYLESMLSWLPGNC